MIMFKIIGLLTIGALLPTDISGACDVTTIRFDWNNKRIGWSASNPDKTTEQAEAILDGAQIVPDVIDRVSVITDNITTITFDIPREIDVLYVEAKLTDSLKISAFDQSNNLVYNKIMQMTNPNVNEGFTFDDFPDATLIKKVEVEPLLGTVSGEARFKNLYMDVCSSVQCSDTARINAVDIGNGITVSNPDKTAVQVVAIFQGTTANPPSLITDEKTTIGFDSARHVKSLYVESKFSKGVAVSASGQSHTKYLSTADTNLPVEFNLLAAGAISSVGVEPVDFNSEGRLKELKIDVCIDTCSVITTSDVTITPDIYANILTEQTWVKKNIPVTFSFSSPVNVKSITLFAKKFNTNLKIVGKTSNDMEVFTWLIVTGTTYPDSAFDSNFQPSDDPLQLSVSKIEMIPEGTRRGKVKDIQITVCPFSQ